MHSIAYLSASVLWLLAAALPAALADLPKPNVVLIMADDMGYGDPGCYGSKVHRTPNIDRLATEGTLFTDYYAAANVCTPTRAALMTGTYHRRNQMHFGVTNPWGVLAPVSPKGLHPDEITVAELLKRQGYATACIGKWHLGDQPEFLPTLQGFDFYYGIPYSNDMGQRKGKAWPPLPLMRDTQVIDAPVNQSTLTPRYTEQALAFIEKHRGEPFFLYLPHTFPHVPLHASDQFRGKSKNGRYGDTIEEIDWSTGQILDKLASLDLDDNTLVIFTSDNGAEVRQAGSNEPLRGRKGSVWEGGHRVPCLMRWPGRVPAGRVCRKMVTCMDMLPTLALLAGAEPPDDRTIDGHDIRPLIFGKSGAESPYQAFYYLARHRGSIQAVRSGPWKLHLKPRQLYNLRDDVGEQNNVAAEHPDIVARLLALAEEQEQDFQQDQRPAGHVDNPQPVTAQTIPLGK